ncbi:hypothetical protein [Accumulibacter sp.]|uniref:hypothetical protein n=1 Tax=Accumulibacter sp. TaxID=2053492 RepID=UPI002878B60F|nr:hypothetical protein [Accumulibacter sp.]MDS4054418.1 hypothetical protein [Accumulibacter sp.]
MRRDAGSKLGASRINDTTMIPAVLQLKRMTLDSCEFFRRAENLLLRSGTAQGNCMNANVVDPLE